MQNNQRNDCIFRGGKSGQMRFGRILGEKRRSAEDSLNSHPRTFSHFRATTVRMGM